MQYVHFCNEATTLNEVIEPPPTFSTIKPRGRKVQETRRRIAEASLRLYQRDGYSRTTLAAIAGAAGVSARTLYLHFPTKEDTLKYWREDGFAHLLPGIMAQLPPGLSPVDAAIAGSYRLLETQDPAHSEVIDRLLESDLALLPHKHAISVLIEYLLFESLCLAWPAPQSRLPLRRIAALVAGAMRVAMDRWREEGATAPIAEWLAEELAIVRPVLAAAERACAKRLPAPAGAADS